MHLIPECIFLFIFIYNKNKMVLAFAFLLPADVDGSSICFRLRDSSIFGMFLFIC